MINASENGAADKRGFDLLGYLRRLTSHAVIYGSADVVSQVLNLLLTPLYVAILTLEDFGIIAILGLFSAVAKIVFRMGLDAGFFRIYYDMRTTADRKALAGSIVVFTAAAGGVLLIGLVIGAPTLAALLFDESQPRLAAYAILVATDVYLGSFLFVPLSLLRIHNRPGRFALLVGARNVVNTALKVALLVSGWGVAGVLASDVFATAALALALTPILGRESRLAMTWKHLRAALAFGLPKAPHGVLIQILNLADRRILIAFHGLSTTGLYDKGYALGAGVKFILSAFEPAWQPFVYSQITRREAPHVFARVATYIWSAFVVVSLAVAVFGRELLVAFTFTNPDFWLAAPIIPLVACAYLLHGAFLLTSIGISIEKKARFYPLITAVSAAVNLSVNFALIPRWGIMGAAWATVVSYGAMAAFGCWISNRLYPIS
ncbi:MAG: oligosaccharide flippase family protein, partial [Vicinamibacteria bacterium]|nr:oligosaccharide flippase family protein [Vicinamibacteria bacterium]